MVTAGLVFAALAAACTPRSTRWKDIRDWITN